MAKTAMQEVREKLTKHFENFRFDKTHHLKFGDIKLTIWEQEEIVNMLDLEIEKEQIIDAYLKGYIHYLPKVDSKEYYNQTYNQP